MAAQAWHPELDEDDRRRTPRRKPRRSPLVVVLWVLVAAAVVLGGGVAAAWFLGLLPRQGAPAASAATTAGAAPAAQQAAAANAPPPPTVLKREVFGDWVYTCVQLPNSQETRCLIAQQLSNPQTHAAVFLWRIAQDGKGGLIGEWETPTGVVVGRGIVLDAGTEKPITVPFQACTQSGCLAVANLAPDFIATLSTAKAATATVFPIGAQGVQLKLSVNGLADGLAALKQ